MRRVGTILGMALVATTLVMAQSASDYSDLERKLADAEAALSRASTAVATVERTTLERELQELQDDMAYLRVKSRRGESISDRERNELADRIDRFTTRVKDFDRSAQSTAEDGRSIPIGTELDVRLQTPLSSRDAQVEQRVEATTMVNFYIGNDLIVPAGSLLVGHVAAVDKASRGDRKGSLSLSFTRLTVNDTTHDVRVSVTQALESEGLKGEVGRIGAGSAVGAILGGILGGVKGAVTGILIGGGGVLIATEGKDVELPTGTVLRVRFDQPVPLGDR